MRLTLVRGLAGIFCLTVQTAAQGVGGISSASCGSVCSGASQYNGRWVPQPFLESSTPHPTTHLAANVTQDEIDSIYAVFTPQVTSNGNFTVTMYTPGCVQDSTCPHRGIANVTLYPYPGKAVSKTIAQTNDFDKYDALYFGFVNETGGSFLPNVTLTPAAGQNLSTLRYITLVAQMVTFNLVTPQNTPKASSNTSGATSTITGVPTSTATSAARFKGTRLSKATKIGIGIGVSIAVIVTVAAIFVIARKRGLRIITTTTKDGNVPTSIVNEADGKPVHGDEMPTKVNITELPAKEKPVELPSQQEA